MIVSCFFEPTDNARYLPIFADEFNGDTSTPDKVWSVSARHSATWNRWVSNDPRVAFVENGNLVLRAIPNTDKKKDSADMLTGALQTRGAFSFQYGKVEARVLTTPHTGNFPAVWMMPEDQSEGWPSCGEIDIFETIDNENRSYHTVHSHWTYDLGKTGSPTSSFNTEASMDRYHTYGFEWTAKKMTWYLDGKSVGSYAKSTSSSTIEQGQWPFDREFYLILNQSVGNGAWAKNADTQFTYETLVDWVRVYQLAEQVGIDTPEDDLSKNGILHDMAGRKVGSNNTPLQPGIYVRDGEKVMVY